MPYKYLIGVLLIAAVCTLPGYSATAAEQVWRLTPSCTGGGKEAETMFLQALSYSLGSQGMPYDPQKAIELYEKSMKLGNPKAAINLGTLYRTAFSRQRHNTQERYEYMNALYQHAADMGCPDGYYFLALSYAKGWGVPQNTRECDRLIKQAAELGSLPGMCEYGIVLDKKGNSEEGKKWLQKALDGGFGLAGARLGGIYKAEKNYSAAIVSYRQGASLGSTDCLIVLHGTYSLGDNGQPIDEEYAACFYKLFNKIDDNAPPPYLDIDTLCPPREVMPYKGE